MILLWVYASYDQLRSYLTAPSAVAMGHAVQVVNLERLLGWNVEAAVRNGAAAVPGLVAFCTLWYSATHILGPPLALIFLYRRDPERYRVWRNALVVILGLALVGFWLFPLLPPRLFPGVAVPGLGSPLLGAAAGSTPGPSGFTNPFAAMPSLHVAWALWTGLALRPLLRHRWARGVAVAYPAVMALSVVVTANHWVIDAAVGALLVPVSVAVAMAPARLRRLVAAPAGA